MIEIGLFLLIFHIISCIIIGIFMKIGLLERQYTMLPIMAAIPIFGEICLLLSNELIRGKKNGNKSIVLEKMQIDFELYKNLHQEQERNHVIIPLEEALLMDNPSVKRDLIMDILNKDTESYLELLNQAKLNEDVEVVHYATTAMSEIAKEADLKLQSLEAEYAVNPDSEEVLQRYIDFLGAYINRGMTHGKFLKIQRVQYDRLLERQMSNRQTLELYLQRIKNQLELELYSEANQLLEQAEKKWPKEETIWLMKIQCMAQQGEGQKVQEVIQNLLKQDIYLSSEGKGIVDFWRRDEEII